MAQNGLLEVTKSNAKKLPRYLAVSIVLTCLMFLLIPPLVADKQKDEGILKQADIVLQDMLNDRNVSPGFEGSWSGPAMLSRGGASVGLRVGRSSSDFVLVRVPGRVLKPCIHAVGTQSARAVKRVRVKTFVAELTYFSPRAAQKESLR